MKDFMPNERPDVRLQILQETAESTEVTHYYRDLEQDEVDEKNRKYLKNAIRISDAKAVLDAAKSLYKAEAGPLEKENLEMVVEIKTRKTLEKGTLFHLANHEEGVMETYNEKGEFIASRRLRPDEKQARLFVNKPSVAQ